MGFFSTLWADIEATWAKIFGSAPGATVAATVVSDIKIVGSALTGALAAFENITGLDSQTLANVQASIAAIEAGALSVVVGIETNIAQPIVTQIANDYKALQGAISGSGITMPGALVNIFKAVTTILPYIEAGVGILTAANSSASATVAASEATGLSAQEARLILGGASAVAVTR
jgi:hypothetical protein